ncbi:hypothetical protein ACP70R_009226 [Stipagrostis hirtigluma subsp. patula]
MDKSWMKLSDRFSKDYIAGVDAFLALSFQHNGGSSQMLCPCLYCANVSHQSASIVRTHLILYGMQSSYTKWIFHGEQANDDEYQVDEQLEDEDEADDFDGFDVIQDLLGDIHRANVVVQEQENQQSGGGNIAESNDGASRFHSLLRSAQRELYPGCKSHSVLSFVLKLVHLKDLNRWSNKSFEMLLKLLKEAFPTGESIPTTYYEAKKMLRDLGLGYESIHACFNDCVLFWKDLEDEDYCPVCKESRWKKQKGKTRRIPRKVLRYFPLIPRLQRLFMNKEIASDLRYHSEKRVVEENVLRHPADGEAWKHLDRLYPWLAQDPRHLRLGLATDGFNPFGIMSSSYSVWPVVVVVYNLPPWRSMKEPFILMPLLIPGKKGPGRDIDVYLRPLVEELKTLFSVGAITYDAAAEETFNLRGVVLWTIHDLPALGSVFGYVPMGYKACPVCLEGTYSQPLRSKIGFLGHRRYLPIHHRWRRSKAFNGKKEETLPPKQLSGNDVFNLLQKLDHLQGFKYGKHRDKKRKAPEKNTPWKNFTKRTILFELPYWKELLLSHNLDVMHIEKNICESLLATLLNISSKTKDTLKARMDLQDMNIRKNLHLQQRGSSVVKPHAYRGRGHGPKLNRRASSSSTSSQQVLEAELAATKLVVATQQATIETQQAKIDHQDKRIDWLTSVMCKMAGISPPPVDDIDIAGQGCSNTWTTSSDGQGSLVSDGISRR